MSATVSILKPAALLAAAAVFLVSCQAGQSQPSSDQAGRPAPAAQTAAGAPVATKAPSDAAATPAGVQAANVQTIRVGLSLPVTGPSERWGAIGERFARMGIDDVNAKGGVTVGGKTYKFDGLTVDDKNDAGAGREAANRLVLAEKIKIFLGNWTTPLAGAQPVFDANKVLVVGAAAGPQVLTAEHPLTFIVMASSPMRSNAVYDWFVKQYPNAKKVAIIEGDDANGRQTVDGIEAQIKAKALTLSLKEFYPLDLKDYDPLVTRVLREKPDAIDVGMGGTKGPLLLGLMKSIHDQGFRGPVLAASADMGALQQGLAYMEGFTIPQLIDRQAPAVTPGEKALADRYIQKYGEKDFEGLLMTHYLEAPILAQAMERAGTVDDTVKLAQVIGAGEFDTIFGKSRFVGLKTFGKNAILEQPIYLSGVRDGKVVTFGSQIGTLP